MKTKFRGYSQMVAAELISMGISYTGEGWVHGYLIQEGNDSYIINGVIEANNEYISISEWIPVFTDSVGQFTGLRDEKGADIYEGDVFKHETGIEYVVIFESGMFGFIRKEFIDWKNRRYIEVLEPLRSANNYGEIVGSIYENPDFSEEQSC